MTEFLAPHPAEDARLATLALAVRTYEIAPVADATPQWAAETIREIADGYAAWLNTEGPT